MKNVLSWKESLNHFNNFQGSLVTIGPVDHGKTAWVESCARRQKQNSLTIISCDLGQVTFGVPGLLSAAVWDPQVQHLCDLKPERMYFIGQTQPAGRFLQTIHGATLLAAWARDKSDTVLIDTDGYVTGPAAREYKRLLLDAFSPCTAIFFGDPPDLAPLLQWCSNQPGIIVYQVQPPASVRCKTPEQRQYYRDSRYLDWFRQAQNYTLSLESNQILSDMTSVGSPISAGEFHRLENVLGSNITWAELNSTHLSIITSDLVSSENAKRLSQEHDNLQVVIKPASQLAGRLVGDYGKAGFSSGMGYITGWKHSPSRITIRGRFLETPGNIWLLGEESFHGMTN